MADRGCMTHTEAPDTVLHAGLLPQLVASTAAVSQRRGSRGAAVSRDAHSAAGLAAPHAGEFSFQEITV